MFVCDPGRREVLWGTYFCFYVVSIAVGGLCELLLTCVLLRQ
jgi:hypothetical protein